MNCRVPLCQHPAKIRGLCRRDYYRATIALDPDVIPHMLDANVDTMRWDPGVSMVCECFQPKGNDVNDFDDQCDRCGRLIAQRVLERRSR